MYLSDVDLRKAIQSGKLIFEPRPDAIDATSIDLHLDNVEQAKVWDIDQYADDRQNHEPQRRELRIADYRLQRLSARYLAPPPDDASAPLAKVSRRDDEIIVRPGGFLLWQTKQIVGTPDDAELIAFVDGKSTRARLGILVHLTAPTIHSSWAGKITLEIANIGPFDIVLQENDVIAQLTVARVACPPMRSMAISSQTFQQSSVCGSRPVMSASVTGATHRVGTSD